MALFLEWRQGLLSSNVTDKDMKHEKLNPKLEEIVLKVFFATRHRVFPIIARHATKLQITESLCITL